jgi:hypothetical protein
MILNDVLTIPRVNTKERKTELQLMFRRFLTSCELMQIFTAYLR